MQVYSIELYQETEIVLYLYIITHISDVLIINIWDGMGHCNLINVAQIVASGNNDAVC